MIVYFSKPIDWRITSKGKPSKKYISYLKKAAKIQKDIDIAHIGKSKNIIMGKKPLKEIVNIKYRATLQDIKDYSKGDFSKTGRIDSLLNFIAEQKYKIIFTKKGTVRKTVKPKTWLKLIPLDKPKKKKTVKKTKTKLKIGAKWF